MTTDLDEQGLSAADRQLVGAALLEARLRIAALPEANTTEALRKECERLITNHPLSFKAAPHAAVTRSEDRRAELNAVSLMVGTLWTHVRQADEAFRIYLP